MGIGSSQNHPTVVIRCTAPPYCIKLAGSRHILIGGGGGASKTGVSNEIQTVLLTYGQIDSGYNCVATSPLPLHGILTSALKTGLYATMNMDVVCIGNPENGRYLIAAGHDEYCYFYLSSGFSISEKNGERTVPTLSFDEIYKVVSDKKPANAYQKTVKIDRTVPGRPQFLVTAGAEGTLRIWDIDSHQLVKGGHPIRMRLEIPAAHEGAVDEVDISPDGCTILSLGSSDGNASFWDVYSGKKLINLPTLPGFSSEHKVRTIQFTNLGTMNVIFVVAYNQKQRTSRSKSYLSLWAFNREKLVCKPILIRQACAESISTMAISDCGNFTAIGTLSGSVGVYSTHEMKPIYFAAETHSIFVTAVEFLPKVAADVTLKNSLEQKQQHLTQKCYTYIPGIAAELKVAVVSMLSMICDALGAALVLQSFSRYCDKLEQNVIGRNFV